MRLYFLTILSGRNTVGRTSRVSNPIGVNSVERISILDSLAWPFNEGEIRNEIEAHLDPGNDDRADSIGSSSAGRPHAAARTARPRRRTTATASDNGARRRGPAAAYAAAGGKDLRHTSQRKDRR